MNKELTIPTLKITYKNDLDLIDIILNIYSIGARQPLRPFEMKVMKYYIKYGFNEEAVQYIVEDEGRKEGDIRVANTHLRNKGYLVLGESNQRKSRLSSSMENLRQSFIEDKKNLYAMVFQREER